MMDLVAAQRMQIELFMCVAKRFGCHSFQTNVNLIFGPTENDSF